MIPALPSHREACGSSGRPRPWLRLLLPLHFRAPLQEQSLLPEMPGELATLAGDGRKEWQGTRGFQTRPLLRSVESGRGAPAPEDGRAWHPHPPL